MLRPTDSPDGPTARSELLWQGLLALVAGALFVRSVTYGWVFDDSMEIVRNTYVHTLSRFGDLVTTTTWTGSGMETYLYRPLTMATYAANHVVSGLDPWSYHLANVVLHSVVTVLVFRLGRLWGLSALAAGIGALLFAVHPVHVEVVANVVGRRDLLATLFAVSAALTHRTALQAGRGRLIAAPLLLAGAMLSKEVGAVGLILVAAQDAYLEDDLSAFFRRPRVRVLYASHLSVLILFLVLRATAVGGLGVAETFYWDNPLVAVGPWSAVATAVAVVGKGLALLVLPITLSPDYSFNAIPVVVSPLDLRLLTTVLVLGVLAWGVTSTRLRRTAATLAVAWYGVALLPTSNLALPVGTIFGERLLYLPSVSFCLAAGAAVAALAARRMVLAGVIAIVLLSGFSIQTVRYTAAWTDDLTLFRWAARAVPTSTKAHHKLGEELLRAGQIGPGLAALDHALAVAPDNEFAAITLAQARRLVADRYGDFDPARPDARGTPDDPRVFYVLGQQRRERGDIAGAVRLWKAALALDSAHAGSLADLGSVALVQSDTIPAQDYFERAVRADPSLASAWFNLAQIHLAQGRSDHAARALQSFVQTAGPRYVEQVAWARRALLNLGRR
jgi:tetratricopeptide (TPR) repeat protein